MGLGRCSLLMPYCRRPVMTSPVTSLDSYYEKPDFGYQHILRFMDLLEEHYDDYLAWLYLPHAVKLSDVIGAKPGISTVDEFCIRDHFQHFFLQPGAL